MQWMISEIIQYSAITLVKMASAWRENKWMNKQTYSGLQEMNAHGETIDFRGLPKKKTL